MILIIYFKLIKRVVGIISDTMRKSNISHILKETEVIKLTKNILLTCFFNKKFEKNKTKGGKITAIFNKGCNGSDVTVENCRYYTKRFLSLNDTPKYLYFLSYR